MISPLEMTALISLCSFFNAFILVSDKAATFNGSSSLILKAFGFLLSFIIALPPLFLLSRHRGMGLIECAYDLTGKFGTVIALLYFCFFMLMSLNTVTGVEFFLTSTVYNLDSQFLILTLFSLLLLYTLYAGLEPLGRTAVVIFVLFFYSVKKLPFTPVLPLAVSAFLCLVAQVLVRGGEERKLHSVIVSTVIILFIGAVAAGFVAVASGGLKKFVSWIINCAYTVLAFFYRCINALFMFLMRLVPEKQYESFAPPEIAGIDTSGAEQQAMVLIDPEKFFITVLCVGLIITAALIIHRIIRGKNAVTLLVQSNDKGLRRKRSKLFDTLKRSGSRFVKALRFRIMCMLSRNTAPGLFMQIEKQSRSVLHGRCEGESCREFLQRAEAVYPHAANELDILANALDDLYFGSGKTMSHDEVKKLRRMIFEKNE